MSATDVLQRERAKDEALQKFCEAKLGTAPSSITTARTHVPQRNTIADPLGMSGEVRAQRAGLSTFAASRD